MKRAVYVKCHSPGDEMAFVVDLAIREAEAEGLELASAVDWHPGVMLMFRAVSSGLTSGQVESAVRSGIQAAR